jgi:hypothetical protein
MHIGFQKWSRRAGLFLGASLVSTACLAADQGPKWTYLEANYTYVDFDDFDADGDLFGVSGSLAVTDLFHLFASYDTGEISPDGPFNIDLDVDQFVLGGGINYPLSDTVDLVGQVGWVHAEVEDLDDDGVGLFGGVRAMVTPQLELNGGVGYVDVGDSDDTSLSLGLVYSFTDMFAVSADVSFGDEVTSYGVGLRFYFQ